MGRLAIVGHDKLLSRLVCVTPSTGTSPPLLGGFGWQASLRSPSVWRLTRRSLGEGGPLASERRDKLKIQKPPGEVKKSDPNHGTLTGPVT